MTNDDLFPRVMTDCDIGTMRAALERAAVLLDCQDDGDLKALAALVFRFYSLGTTDIARLADLVSLLYSSRTFRALRHAA